MTTKHYNSFHAKNFHVDNKFYCTFYSSLVSLLLQASPFHTGGKWAVCKKWF